MKQHFLKKKVKGKKKFEARIWVEPGRVYSRILIIMTRGSIPEEYFRDIHKCIVDYAKEQRKKHGHKEEIQCQRGTITPYFLEMYVMKGDEQERINKILEILTHNPGWYTKGGKK